MTTTSESMYVHSSIWEGPAMFKPHHKQRIRGRGVARSDAYGVEERGSVGGRPAAARTPGWAEKVLRGDATMVDPYAHQYVSAPGPVTRLADMSPEKRAALLAQYQPPGKKP